jgi:signal transduction histidine kinase
MSNAHEKPAKMHTPEPQFPVASQNDEEIAGEIPHDCNNLLTVILEHAELLAIGNLSPETRAKYIERIESATKQIRYQIDRAAHSQVARDWPKAIVARN